MDPNLWLTTVKCDGLRIERHAAHEAMIDTARAFSDANTPGAPADVEWDAMVAADTIWVLIVWVDKTHGSEQRFYGATLDSVVASAMAAFPA